MALSRTTSRIFTLSLLSVLLALVAYDDRLQPSQSTGLIFYNCYSCDAQKSCSLVVAHSESEAGLPCTSLGLHNSCAQACNCPSGTWPCEQIACHNEFTKPEKWISYQPNVAEGFLGAVYDRNRYLYFVPNRGDAGPHGVVWRYDTIAVLNTQPSWTVFDPSAQGLGPAAQGFAGGAFDGKYVYFSPNRNASGPSGSVMRYDTTKAMNAIGSWELFDPSTNGLGSSAKGFNGAVFDGKYVYFVPDVNGGGAHNNVMRYEVSKPFKDASSWQLFNPKSATAAKKGYGGALYDGRYVYFIPKGGGNQSTAPTADAHGEVMRYDTRGDFQSANSWTMFDPSSSGLGSNARGYHGGVFDGAYLYFAPYINGSGPHGQVLRYNTKQSFTAAASWSTFNVDTVPTEGGAKGYTGAAFDGQYVYFSPYYNGQAYHGKVARYDTKDTFTSKTAWTVFDAGTAQNVVTGTATSSAASAATLGTGGRFGIIERDDITVHPDGSITMRSGGSATVQHSCLAAINVPAGYTTNGIRCDLKNGAGQSLFPPNSDARTRNVGAFTITSTTAQTFTFSCDYTISNWISSYPHNVCSISIPVKIAP